MAESRGVLCFVLGLGAGVAGSLLLTPRTGEETRRQLRIKADEGKDYLYRQSECLKEQGSEYLERGREILHRQRENLSAAVEAGKQAYRDVVSEDEDRGETGPGA